MALFNKKDNIPTASIKPPKKNKKDDTTPMYDNPAFDIVDPASSFNVKSGFVPKKEEPEAVEILTQSQPETQGQMIDPSVVQQTVSQTSSPLIEPVVVQQTVSTSTAQVIDPAIVQQTVAKDSQSNTKQTMPQQSYDAVQGQLVDPTTTQPEYDINTSQTIDPAMVQIGYDPITGLPSDSTIQQTPYATTQGQTIDSINGQVGYDPMTGQPLNPYISQSSYNPNSIEPTEYEMTEMNTMLSMIDQSNNMESSAISEVNTTNAGTPSPTTTTSGQQTGSIMNTQKVQRPVFRYRYTIINGLGKKETGTFEAESEDDVRSFLASQDYQVLEVKERSKSDIDITIGDKLGASDLSFSLTQLSTYLRAGIPLADSVKILAKQTKKANLKKHFNQLVYQLLKGESLSEAMLMQGNVFPKLLINMVKTAEMTGDLPSILDDMSEYYTSMDQTKKQMKSAMTYPAVVLTIAVGVLVFMLTYLVPQFTSMFDEQGAELPGLTKAIVGVSKFISTKWMYLLFSIVLIGVGFFLLYRNVKGFKRGIQIILMHLPVIKDVIIYNEMANFSKTFASLLNHSVFITDSMEILSKITENEVYKSIINTTLENLSRGESISSAFRGQWAIPIVAYEMIVTGESTGQLGAMMEKVAAHFQMLHKNVIDQMKSLVEPIMIVFLAGIVGVILVSIIQPMFSIYSQIK